MAVHPGAPINVTARVTSWTESYSSHTGTDNAGATITIDNQSPGNVTGATAAVSTDGIGLSWTIEDCL